ncbi:unnamed protein product [Vitrella brassicaformis CCMP3155]|uniref:Uncharacterized protein n=2 Tax=Vitrella brassicaformis TaxID=1169539 RepID=A0A0G4GUV4_VITBC|nr:unnamed protein product [Vitrella brassicaformis CCMP3155]|eukprot:CEM34400.1 unnamed protein product [Vitrella brassicaformis CCMP3155]
MGGGVFSVLLALTLVVTHVRASSTSEVIERKVSSFPSVVGEGHDELPDVFSGSFLAADREVLYLFVKSERPMETSPPVIVWFGPRPSCSASALHAAFNALGPLQLTFSPNTRPTLQSNTHSWHKAAHLLFVDFSAPLHGSRDGRDTSVRRSFAQFYVPFSRKHLTDGAAFGPACLFFAGEGSSSHEIVIAAAHMKIYYPASKVCGIILGLMSYRASQYLQWLWTRNCAPFFSSIDQQTDPDDDHTTTDPRNTLESFAASMRPMPHDHPCQAILADIVKGTDFAVEPFNLTALQPLRMSRAPTDAGRGSDMWEWRVDARTNSDNMDMWDFIYSHDMMKALGRLHTIETGATKRGWSTAHMTCRTSVDTLRPAYLSSLLPLLPPLAASLSHGVLLYHGTESLVNGVEGADLAITRLFPHLASVQRAAWQVQGVIAGYSQSSVLGEVAGHPSWVHYVVMPGVSHSPTTDRPREMLDLLGKFIRGDIGNALGPPVESSVPLEFAMSAPPPFKYGTHAGMCPSSVGGPPYLIVVCVFGVLIGATLAIFLFAMDCPSVPRHSSVHKPAKLTRPPPPRTITEMTADIRTSTPSITTQPPRAGGSQGGRRLVPPPPPPPAKHARTNECGVDVGMTERLLQEEPRHEVMT